jgi:amino acid permease
MIGLRQPNLTTLPTTTNDESSSSSIPIIGTMSPRRRRDPQNDTMQVASATPSVRGNGRTLFQEDPLLEDVVHVVHNTKSCTSKETSTTDGSDALLLPLIIDKKNIIEQKQPQKSCQDPLANPAKFATTTPTAANTHHNHDLIAPYQVTISEAQLKAALDCFGSAQENENEHQENWALHHFIVKENRIKEYNRTTTLQSTSPHSHRSVVMGSVACLCSATLGAGILSLPYAMAQAGMVYGMTMLFASAVATAYSIQLLVQAMQVVYYSSHDNNGAVLTTTTTTTTTTGQQQQRQPEKTYEDLVELCLGKAARRVAEASMLIFCSGGAVAYVIAVGDILQQSGLLEHLPKALSHQMARAVAMSAVWIVAMVPLSMLRTMKSLECTSSIGIASITTLVFAALFHYLEHHGDSSPSDRLYHYKTSMWLFHGAETVGGVKQSILWPTQGFVSILRACPIILFAFSCQVNVCAIYDEMKGGEQQPSRSEEADANDADIPELGTIEEETPMTSLTVSATLQAAQHHGDPVTSYTTKYRQMIQVTWIAVGICALLYSSISIIALLDFGSDNMTPNILSKYDPESVMQVAFIGMALAVVLAYPMNIFPARVTLLGIFRSHRLSVQTGSRPSQNNDNNGAPDGVKIDLSEPLLLLESPLETTRESFDTARESYDSAGESEHDAVTVPVSNVLERDNTSPAHEDSADSLGGHILATLFLTGGSLGLAIVAPNISVVFGLLGGTCSSVLGFVLPGLLGYMTADDFHQVADNEANRGAADRTRFLSSVLAAAGLLIGIITTGVTVYSTFATPPRNNNSILTFVNAN